VGGLVLAVVLLAGLSVSGGALWAGLGFALLLPMIAGSVYLCVRFLRSSP
jgi:mannose/fructose/N-acetylgalactosamine-specific phosphotransferase system component IIC